MTLNRAALYAALALAALTIAAALGLGHVFADGSFALPIIGAAVLPHLVGGIARARRWHGVVLTIVTIACVLVYAALVIAPSSTTYGFPGSGTIEALAHRMSDGWDVFRTGRAPVPVTDGVLLLCMVLTALVAATADALAFRSEATLAAVVPSLLLFVFASTLGTTELRTATTIGYSIVALVFLMLQHQALLESHRSWASGRRLGSQATLVNAAAFVGGIALLAGIVIAPALPGADDGPLLDYRSIGGSSSNGPGSFRTLSPLVDLRGRLTERPDTELFTVEAPRRLYWRIAALDHFDGQVWGIESQARDVGEALGRRRPPGTIRQEFTITYLDDRWLPAAYEPLATDLEDARIVPESGTLVAPDTGISGLRYRIDSRVPGVPTQGDINRTLSTTPAAVRSSLELPDNFPPSVRTRARGIVAGIVNPYEKARALEDYFLTQGFTYDLNGPTEGSGTDAITAFLDSKRGFCEQFRGGVHGHGAFDRAAHPRRGRLRPGGLRRREGRLLGAGTRRSRLAGGLARGSRLDPVRTDPGRRRAGPGRPDDRPAGRCERDHRDDADHGHDVEHHRCAFEREPGPARGESEVQAGSPSGTGTGSSNRHWIILAAVAVLVLLVAIGWLAAHVTRKVRRRARRRRRTIPAHSVAGAWQDALERLSDAGLPPSDTLTPHEQAHGYAERGAPSDATASLQDLANLYAEAGWSLREMTDDDVARAWTDADSVRDALAEGASNRERVRRALRL